MGQHHTAVKSLYEPFTHLIWGCQLAKDELSSGLNSLFSDTEFQWDWTLGQMTCSALCFPWDGSCVLRQHEPETSEITAHARAGVNPLLPFVRFIW